MLPSAQLIIIELGCLDLCNRNMRKFVVKYNQMECNCKHTSCFGNKMYYFGLLAFRQWGVQSRFRVMCLSWAKMRTQNYVAKHAHAQSLFGAFKTDL